MASLILIRSPLNPPPFDEVVLSADPKLIGRIPVDCQIVIRDDAVSKRHARIYLDAGTVFIEDLKSRNKTYVNGRRLTPHEPVPLKPDDEIRICDYVFLFSAADEQVSMEATHEFLVAPADRLKALVALSSGSPVRPDLGPLLNQVADTLFSTNLSKMQELDPLLNQMADTLLGVFKQADRCFLLLNDEFQRPQPRVTRSRRHHMDEVRHSRGMVKKTIESMRSHLAVQTPGSCGGEPRSIMCVPLATSEGRAFGAIQLETRDCTDHFAEDDLNLLTIVASLASVAVERVQLHVKAKAQAVVQSQIDLAREVQLGFLPQRSPVVEGYEFYSHYSPAQTVGGDFYDFVPLPERRLAIVLGDVAGKALPAALLVAKLSSEVRFSLLTEPDPAKAVFLLNQQMFHGLGDKFVTVVVMVLDPDAHQLTIVNAGHAIPQLYSSKEHSLRDLISLDTTGVPLGVEEGYKYLAESVSLNPGDTITAYTDGVTDAMDPADKTFGAEAVARYLAPVGPEGPDAARPRRVGEALLNAIRLHTKGRTQNDDIAIVSFGRWDQSSDSNSTLNGQGSGSGGSGE